MSTTESGWLSSTVQPGKLPSIPHTDRLHQGSTTLLYCLRVRACVSVCLFTFLLPQDSLIRLGWPQWARDVSTSACLALKVQGMLPCAALYCGPGDWNVVLMTVRWALYLMSFLSRLLLIIFNKGLCSLILCSPCPLWKLWPWSEWSLNWKTHSILSSKWWVGRMDTTQD